MGFWGLLFLISLFQKLLKSFVKDCLNKSEFLDVMRFNSSIVIELLFRCALVQTILNWSRQRLIHPVWAINVLATKVKPYIDMS